MKIIKRGEVPADSIHRGTCNTCKTQVEAKRSELTEHTCNWNNSLLSAACPICRTTIWFNPKGRAAT